MAKNTKLVQSINSSFELKCLDLLTKSYVSSISENLISKDWDEESFSAHLVKHLRKIKNDFIINYEAPLVEKDVFDAKKKVKNSNRIDIFFQKTQWGKFDYLEYHVEAKNISSSQWTKLKGSKVSASDQQTEYITKGIDRFLTGHFKYKNGCMLGYIVQGKLEDILIKINNKIELQKNRTETINFKNQLINNQKIYESSHLQRNMKHLFFNYSN